MLGENLIAPSADVLAFHIGVSTYVGSLTFVAQFVIVIVCATVCHKQTAYVAGVVIIVVTVFIALGSANLTTAVGILVDTHVKKLSAANVAYVVRVLVTVLSINIETPGGFTTGVADSVLVIIGAAIVRHPYAAGIADVVIIGIVVLSIHSVAIGSFSAIIAEGILIFINVCHALNLCAAEVTYTVTVIIDTYVGHRYVAYVADVVIVLIDVHFVQ